VVIVPGITHFATVAAGEFLTREEYFQQALAEAPSDWHRKNMQVGISADVISGAAGPPKVQETHFW